MRNKRNIKSFGKTLAYLQDPHLRKKETGDALLIIDSAEIMSESFEGKIWRNVSFKNCDFIGAYEVKLAAMENCTFEECRFSGIFAWGVQNTVSFIKCGIVGVSHLWGSEGSKAVTYQQCTFAGTSSDPNQQGSVGTYGDAAFIECNGKWFGVLGHSALLMHSCEFDSMNCLIDARESSGIVPNVVVSDCKLRGKFDMVSSVLQSLAIRDTVLEELNLSNATVKGDVVIERVRGGYINAYVKEAKRLSVHNSQIYGNRKKVFEAYAGGIRAIEIDTVIFGGDLSTEPVTVAGGTGADLGNVRARVNDSIVVRNSKVPRLSAHHVNTSLLQLQGCELESLDLSNGRIANLQLSGNAIVRSVDFTNTQVKESNVQSLAKGQAKLEGSNIKIN